MVTKMLEKAIEIEGLLRIIRDGNPGPEVFNLLKEKSAELADEIKLLDNSEGISEEIDEKSNEPIDMKTESEETEEVPIEAPEEEPEEEPMIEESEDEPLEELKEESEEESFEEAEEESISKDQGPCEESHNKESEEETFDMQEEEATDDDIQNPDGKDNEEDDDIMLTFDLEEAETDSKDPEIDMTKEVGGKVTTTSTGFKRQTKLKSSFSLNDRFLYSRELFDGNMKMFDSTLEFIEGIEDFPIIEDYFYNELEWDPENLHVATFMEILRPNFRE